MAAQDDIEIEDRDDESGSEWMTAPSHSSTIAERPKRPNYVAAVRQLMGAMGQETGILYAPKTEVPFGPLLFDVTRYVGAVKRPEQFAYPSNVVLLAFSQAVYSPTVPPRNPWNVTTWEEFDDQLEKIEYLSPLWSIVHKMFVTARGIATATGYGHMSIELHYAEQIGAKKAMPNKFAIAIPLRGTNMECLGTYIFERIVPDLSNIKLRKPLSKVCKIARWLMGTPDMEAIDNTTGEVLFNVEVKVPSVKAAFDVIPVGHMMQMHFASLTNGAKICYYVCLKIDDRHSERMEIYVHKVWLSEAYIRAVVPVVTMVYACILSAVPGALPLPKKSDLVLPDVRSEVVFHMEAPTDIFSELPMKYSAAYQQTQREAADRYSEDMMAWIIAQQQQQQQQQQRDDSFCTGGGEITPVDK